MDFERHRTWIDIARALHPDRDPDGAIERTAAYVSSLIDASNGAWDAVVDARMVDDHVSDTCRAAETCLSIPTHFGVNRKCLRIAWNVVGGTLDLIPRHERESARARLSTIPSAAASTGDWPPPGPPPAGPGGPFPTVPAMFVRRLGPRRRAMVTGVANHVLQRIRPDMVETVARFRTPVGTTVDIVAVDGILHRPVLEPGSWRPVDLSLFAEAAAQGHPWRDNPFNPPEQVAAALDGMMDLGCPTSSGKGADAKADARAADTAMGRSGRLVVIDDIVHRPVPHPTWRLAVLEHRRDLLQDPGRWAIKVGWYVDETFNAFATQSTLAGTMPIVNWSGKRGGAPPAPCLGWPSLPIPDKAEALRFASSWPMAYSRVDLAALDDVTVMMPDAATPDPRAHWAEAVAEFAGLGPVGGLDEAISACHERDVRTLRALAERDHEAWGTTAVHTIPALLRGAAFGHGEVDGDEELADFTG